MKRKLEICHNCPQMCKLPEAIYLCLSSHVRIGLFTATEKAMDVKCFESSEVPDTCDRYAEYFVEECNEEKI